MSSKSKNGQTVEENRAETAAPETQGSGVRSVRALKMKDFLPNLDWINKNVVAKGVGTKVLIGRVFGLVTGTSDKKNTLPNGEVSESILTQGMLMAESYLTGEISEATGAFLPGAVSEKFKVMFAGNADLRTIECDLDIGLRATGKAIPYEWVVIQHVEGEQLEPLKRLRSSRGRPEGAAALIAPAAAPALTAQ